MENQPSPLGYAGQQFIMDPQRSQLLPPELKAAPSESLTEQMFIGSLTENRFWLRIMMEHSRFIASLLDQSERNLVITARKFGDDFEVLLNQARDVESMLYQMQPTYPIVAKMQKDNENATMELRSFKKAGLELIKTCQIRNVISPLLADHVLREAEHFLFMIKVLEGRLQVQ